MKSLGATHRPYRCVCCPSLTATYCVWQSMSCSIAITYRGTSSSTKLSSWHPCLAARAALVSSTAFWVRLPTICMRPLTVR
ncbi:hypothetical protein GBAR_LOCUS16125 [Geodia barretti]|uniref:Uncharacterized protein n=1 Tax=Geodia barretti TaxID=519541 RepID=A0AA35WNT1_GEOBA|nr:hypothetical protein GBAR_LOCUS16125 [Geodia barretti]